MRPRHPRPHSSRLRRWLVGACLIAALVLAYGLGLNWFADRLGDDIEKSVRVPEAVGGGVIAPR